MKEVLTAVLIIVGALSAVVAAGLVALYFVVFYSPHKGQNDDLQLPPGIDYSPYGELPVNMIKGAMRESFETVEIVSEDGLRLRGRLYVRHPESAPLALGFHGYRGTPARDFSGGLISMLEAGFNVLLVEQRAHGRSAGHTITFGIKERRDCVRWAEYAAGRFGQAVPTVLFGISMGASTVLMASGEALPANVRWIVADCPYNAPEEIIKSVIAKMKLPAGFFYFFVNLSARIFGRFNPREITARDSVARTGIPVTIIHGREDGLVPCEMSAKIPGDNRNCERFVFDNADHGLSYLEDKARYERIVAEIFRRLGDQRTFCAGSFQGPGD